MLKENKGQSRIVFLVKQSFKHEGKIYFQINKNREFTCLLKTSLLQITLNDLLLILEGLTCKKEHDEVKW